MVCVLPADDALPTSQKKKNVGEVSGSSMIRIVSFVSFVYYSGFRKCRLSVGKFSNKTQKWGGEGY